MTKKNSVIKIKSGKVLRVISALENLNLGKDGKVSDELLQKISVDTGASVNTVKTQMYKLRKR